MTGRCPFQRVWCAETNPDPDDHACRSVPVELPSGWSVELTQDGDEAGIYLADPDYLLPAALTGRLSLLDALDLIVALAGAVHDARASSTHHTIGA